MILFAGLGTCKDRALLVSVQIVYYSVRRNSAEPDRVVISSREIPGTIGHR